MITEPMITEPMLLPTDVRLVPVGDLPPSLRRQLDADPADVTVSRPATRVAGLLIDADSAALLEEFRRPTPIVDAVLRRSHTVGSDPDILLDDAFNVLGRLLAVGMLVPANSAAATPLVAGQAPGQRLDRFEIVRAVQVLTDSEVYRACDDEGRPVAIKLARVDAPSWVVAVLEREASILGHLGGGVAPELLVTGTWQGCRYLALEWIEGEAIGAYAAALRRLSSPRGQRRLLALARRLVDAYRQLHERGVLHGDVHPGNLLVEADGAVRVIDFGLARRPDTTEAAAVARGGVPFFLEPEHAAALMAGSTLPASSEAGEQYALGVLLDSLITGRPYLSFAAEKEKVWRQITVEEPTDFAARGTPPWPDLERVLRRALAKAPRRRYPDLGAFAAALAEVEPPAAVAPPAVGVDTLENVVETMLELLGPSSPWLDTGLPVAPLASLNCGAAGVAYGLLRLAVAREDAAVLSSADLWIARAASDAALPGGFAQPTLGMSDAPPRRGSIWNGPAGVDAVEAMIAGALDDRRRQQRALVAFATRVEHCFLTDAEVREPVLDVTDGVAGALVATALLLAETGERAGGPLRRLGRSLCAHLWQCLADAGDLGTATAPHLTGVAHGWAGFLYATLLWNRVAGGAVQSGEVPEVPEEIRSEVERRLDQLARLAEPAGRAGRGRRFKASLASADAGVARLYWSGWCNGSAGLVCLWSLAREVLGGTRWGTLAEGSAWHAWEGSEATASLCCGMVGRAYALANLHRLNGDSRWLVRARSLAERAVDGHRPLPQYVHSLYQGDLGLAVLAAELERPEAMALPFFEPAR